MSEIGPFELRVEKIPVDYEAACRAERKLMVDTVLSWKQLIAQRRQDGQSEMRFKYPTSDLEGDEQSGEEDGWYVLAISGDRFVMSGIGVDPESRYEFDILTQVLTHEGGVVPDDEAHLATVLGVHRALFQAERHERRQSDQTTFDIPRVDS